MGKLEKFSRDFPIRQASVPGIIGLSPRGLERILVRFATSDEAADIRLTTIAENLRRADLTVQERAKQIAE
jgi:hypothetical protein